MFSFSNASHQIWGFLLKQSHRQCVCGAEVMPCSNQRLVAPRNGIKWSQGGSSLIEVLAALAILAMLGVTFLSALAVSSKAVFIAKERTTAESLSQAQMEYVMQCDYDDINVPPQYRVDGNLTIPSGYSVGVNAERLDSYGDGLANDDGVQNITVRIYHGGKLVIATEGYKARHE